jgi:acetylornithine/succinyldiaminopimelate/putrescine aminotransferase|tara:strand:- start:1145 stop:1432 length:288 start_codon:yes stop_codon:yes gene_type:complete
MIVQLIKDHIFVTKVVPKGTNVEVTDGNGQELIDNGIATDVTVTYKKRVTKAKEKQIAEQVAMEEKADEDRVDMLAEKVAEKIQPEKKKKNNKNK